jgi:hypothetical protein
MLSPGPFHVVACTVCGAENEKSPTRVGLPPIMALKSTNRRCWRLKTHIGYDQGE